MRLAITSHAKLLISALLTTSIPHCFENVFGEFHLRF